MVGRLIDKFPTIVVVRDIHESLGVEWSPANKKRNNHGSYNREDYWYNGICKYKDACIILITKNEILVSIMYKYLTSLV